MRKQLTKFFSLIVAAACLVSPLSLSASHCHKSIRGRDVAGTYQISGDSNSFPAAPLGIESQGAVGQITLNNDGTGVVSFADFTFVTVAGTVTTQHFTNVLATYTLGPVDGEGSLTLIDFPILGASPVFALSFKKEEHKVNGFSAVITSNTTSNLVTLLQGVRFN